LGGKIVKRIWNSGSDPAAVSQALPRRGVDGVVVSSLWFGAAASLAKVAPLLRGGLSTKLIVSSGTVYPQLGKLGPRISGVVTAYPLYLNLTGDPPGPGLAYKAKYMRSYLKAFPAISSYLPGGWFDVGYYNPVAATLQALDRIHGDLSHGERRFM